MRCPTSRLRSARSRSRGRVRRWANRNRTAVASVAVAFVAGVVGFPRRYGGPDEGQADITRALGRERYANQLAASNDELALPEGSGGVETQRSRPSRRSRPSGVSEGLPAQAGPVQRDPRPALEIGPGFLRQAFCCSLGRETDLAAAGRALGVELRAGRPDRQGRGKDVLIGRTGVVLARVERWRRSRGRRCGDGGRRPERLIEIAGPLATGKRAGERRELPMAGVAALRPGGHRPGGSGRAGGSPVAAGRVLLNTSQTAERRPPAGWARADQEALAAALGVPAAAGSDLATTVYRIGSLLMRTGKLSEAEVEFRRAGDLRGSWPPTTPPSAQFR